MMTLTINGQRVNPSPGYSVLEAAQHNDIYIPTLCHHPQLRPAGACRLCVVEIEGMRGLPTACTTPAAEGMAVQTNTPAVRDLRREVLSLILSEHPYTCLVCGRRDRCDDWQVTIRKAGVTTGCENCPKNGQCELQCLVENIGLSAMPYPISYRGLPVEKEDPFFDRDYNLCILCGRCVRVCQEVRHTGTLAFTSRGPESRVGTAFDLSHLELDCEFCGSCVDVCPTGALFDKRTKWEGVPTSTATTVCPYCSVGCQLNLWVKNGKVIGVRPAKEGLVNRGQACTRGRFGVVEMVHAADRLRVPLIRKNGRLSEATWDEALKTAAEKLAAYPGDAFALLASPHLTNESAYVLQKFARQVMNSRNVDCATALPRHARTGELQTLLQSNHRGEIQQIRQADCILVIGANPRLSHPVVALYIRQALNAGAKLIVVDPRQTELSRRAHIWLQPKPGTDAALLEKLLAAMNTQHATRNTREAARLLAENGPVVILYGSGVTHYPSAPDTIRAIQQLAEALTPQAGILPLVGAANTLGALNVGALANGTGRNYTEIVAGIQAGEIKALYLAGEAPPLEVLDKLEFLVVQDILPSSNLDEYANVVLPAASFAEMSGTLTNLEGRTQRFEAAIPPVGDARPDWLIAAQLAQTMGAAGFDYRTSVDVWAEIETSDRWQVAGGKWQVAGTEHATRNTQSRLTSKKFPLLLITERNQFAYRGNALTERVKGMNQVKSDESRVTLHPDDAARMAVTPGNLVRLTTPHGSDTFIARLSAEVPPGTAFASVNSASGSAIFPAMLPEVKTYAVRIEKEKS